MLTSCMTDFRVSIQRKLLQQGFQLLKEQDPCVFLHHGEVRKLKYSDGIHVMAMLCRANLELQCRAQ